MECKKKTLMHDTTKRRNGMQKEDFNAWYYSMECKKKTLMHDTNGMQKEDFNAWYY